jgi:hypothetical protein
MTAFHTDEYIHFLNRVTPETAEELTFGGQRCEYHFSLKAADYLTRVSPGWGG